MIQLKSLDLHGREFGFELIKKQEIEGREAPLCLEPQTCLRSCAQRKIDHQGAWIVLDVFQILTSILSIPFPVSFQSFLALPWRQWGTVLNWHSLLGVREWGGGLQRRVGSLPALEWE